MNARNLDLWVEYLCSQPIPVFHHTVRAILHLSADEKTSCKQLADTILGDPVFTARVLSIVNSAYYNRSGETLTDIRRAVLLIGFNKIIGICLTVSVVDTIVNKSTLQHIVTLLKRSLQRALLARAIAEHRQLPRFDDVFVAGLLYEFGEIAFWSLTGPCGREIYRQLAVTHLPGHRAQREILGVTFDEITLALTNKWRLSPLLATLLLNPTTLEPHAKCLLLCHELLEQLQQTGDTHRQALTELGRFAELSDQDAAALVETQLREAAHFTDHYFPAL